MHRNLFNSPMCVNGWMVDHKHELRYSCAADYLRPFAATHTRGAVAAVSWSDGIENETENEREHLENEWRTTIL